MLKILIEMKKISNVFKNNMRLYLALLVGVFLLVVLVLALRFYERGTERIPQRFSEICKNTAEFRRCYTPLFMDLAEKVDARTVLDMLSQTQKIDPRLNDCHYIAHDMTYVIVKKDKQQWLDMLKGMNLSWCSTGFMHGTILSLGLDQGSDPEQVSKLDRFCEQIIATQHDKKFIEGSCYHATGHVFIIEKSGDIDKALEVCNLYNTIKKRQDCSIGVFMESVQRDALVDHLLARRNTWSWEEMEEQEKVCRRYDTVTARACWMEMWPLYKANSWRTASQSGNLKSFYSLCGRAGEERSQDRCYQYGIYTVVDNGLKFLTNEDLMHACDIYREDKMRRTECVLYTGGAFIRSNAVQDLNVISGLCENGTVGNEKDCCQYFKSSSKQQLQKDVASIEDNFTACMLDGGKVKEYHEVE